MASELKKLLIETEGRSKYLQLGKFKPPVIKMLGDTLDTGSVLHEPVIQTHALTLQKSFRVKRICTYIYICTSDTCLQISCVMYH